MNIQDLVFKLILYFTIVKIVFGIDGLDLGCFEYEVLLEGNLLWLPHKYLAPAAENINKFIKGSFGNKGHVRCGYTCNSRLKVVWFYHSFYFR